MKMKKSAMMDKLCKGGMTKEAARDFIKVMPADSYEDDDVEEVESADVEDLEKSLAVLSSRRRVAELEVQIAEMTANHDALVKSLVAADEIAENSAATLDRVLVKSFDALKLVEENQATLAKGMQSLAAKFDDLVKSMGAPMLPRSLSGTNHTPPPAAPAGSTDRAKVSDLIKSLSNAATSNGNLSEVKRLASIERMMLDGRITPADAQAQAKGN